MTATTAQPETRYDDLCAFVWAAEGGCPPGTPTPHCCGEKRNHNGDHSCGGCGATTT